MQIYLPKQRSTGTRHFIGAPQFEIDERAKRLSESVRISPLQVTIYENVDLAPLAKQKSNLFEGGIFHRREYLAHLSLHRSGAPLFSPPDRTPQPTHSLNDAWYGGVLFAHYGHFLLEGLARLAYRDLVASDLPIVFFNPHNLTKLLSYMVEIFSSMGIDHERIVLLNESLRVSRLRAGDPFIELDSFINVSARPFFQNRSPAIPSKDLIYLSRSRLGSGRRKIFDEHLLESAISSRGGSVVWPEKMPLYRQLSAIEQHRTVISPQGSALHSLILLGGRPLTIVMFPGSASFNFILLDEIQDGDVFYIKAYDARKDEATRSWQMTQQTIDRVLEIAGELRAGALVR